MQILDKFREHACRALTIASHSESGNEELVRYYQTILHDFGFKSQVQEVRHSVEGLSRRQLNLIGYTSDMLVDRTTRKGVLWISPLDIARPKGALTSSSDPQALRGPGAVQGKIDYLCRIYAALDLVDHRHKNPLYLVGAAASHYGMMGSRFLIESLMVNPKEVYTFAPTQMKKCKKAPGHLAIALDLDSPNRSRDARGYNRAVEIRAKGEGQDLANAKDSVNALELLLDLLLAAAQAGFDFQWSELRLGGAEACNPEEAFSKIYLTSFQFEDFKQFVRERVEQPQNEGRFYIDYLGVTEGGTQFLPTELIEVILELDHEWKKLVEGLNQFENTEFELGYSTGALTKIEHKSIGKCSLHFELRFLPQHQLKEIQAHWRQVAKEVLEKHSLFHFQMTFPSQVPGVDHEDPHHQKSSNYMSDAGFFDKAKFPTTILGAGSVRDFPKGKNEQIAWSELEKAINTYRTLMLEASQT